MAGWHLALEQNVDLTVGSVLHLRQVDVCERETDKASTGPDVTALATKVGLLCSGLAVARSSD